jgi:hypothetical protein
VSTPAKLLVHRRIEPSELEQAFAFETELGISPEAARALLCEDIEAWCAAAEFGGGSTECFRHIMRDARLVARRKKPAEIASVLTATVRRASLYRLAIYVRFRRRMKKVSE